MYRFGIALRRLSGIAFTDGNSDFLAFAAAQSTSIRSIRGNGCAAAVAKVLNEVSNRKSKDRQKLADFVFVKLCADVACSFDPTIPD
jgi:hypothetical protein